MVRIYAYESEDGVNWQLVGNIVLTIGSHFQPGMVLSTVSSLITTSFVDVAVERDQGGSQKQVQYTIDANEIVTADYISAGLIERTERQLNGATSGSFTLPVGLTESEPTISAKLTSKNGDIIAEDLVILGLKESLSFNAASSARVSILRTAFLFNIEGDRLLQLYTEIDSHPRFNELVELYKAEKRVPINETRSDLAAELTAEITIDLLYSMSYLIK